MLFELLLRYGGKRPVGRWPRARWVLSVGRAWHVDRVDVSSFAKSVLVRRCLGGKMLDSI